MVADLGNAAQRWDRLRWSGYELGVLQWQLSSRSARTNPVSLDSINRPTGSIIAASGAQITVTKTQSMPGVGPTDNGSFLVALAAHEQPTDNSWWPWALGGGVLVIAAGLMAWVVIRRKRSADLTVSA